jgi:hypothetical protein
VAFLNYHDDTSTTVSANTPGKTLDLRNRTTLSRSGVPVRLKVFATSSVAGDTGVFKIVDENGADMVVVAITGGGSSNLDTHGAWYVADGELPATLAKYDPHYGGNTLGTLYVKDFCLYELAQIGPPEGELAASIGEFALSATGTVA